MARRRHFIGRKIARREGLDRPRSSGQWTEARFRDFIMNALRAARWGPKYECIAGAFVRRGANPATGKTCMLHVCAKCEGLFPKGKMQADHIVPVIGPEGFVDWNTAVARMFVEVDGYQALCIDCHQLVTNMARFNLTEQEALDYRRVVDFSKLSTVRQNQILLDHDCPRFHMSNATRRRAAYHHLLREGSFEGLVDPSQGPTYDEEVVGGEDTTGQ